MNKCDPADSTPELLLRRPLQAFFIFFYSKYCARLCRRDARSPGLSSPVSLLSVCGLKHRDPSDLSSCGPESGPYECVSVNDLDLQLRNMKHIACTGDTHRECDCPVASFPETRHW